jgi:hypothetical protein
MPGGEGYLQGGGGRNLKILRFFGVLAVKKQLVFQFNRLNLYLNGQI